MTDMTSAVVLAVPILAVVALVLLWPKLKNSDAFQQRQTAIKAKAEAVIEAKAATAAALRAEVERMALELEIARTGTLTPIDDH